MFKYYTYGLKVRYLVLESIRRIDGSVAVQLDRFLLYDHIFLLHMVEVELEHVGSLRKSASGWLSEDLIQGKYDGIVAVPFMLLLFWSFFILFKNCSC